MQRNFEDLLQMKCTGTPTMQYITRRRSKKKAVRSLASTVVKLTTRKKTAESKMQSVTSVVKRDTLLRYAEQMEEQTG